MKKILCVVFIICLLMLSACSVTTEDKVKLFDEVCSSIDELFATDENGNHYTLPNEDEIYEKIGKDLRILGLIYDLSNEDIVPIGEEFVEAYLTAHTSEELLENYFKIYDFITDNYRDNYSYYTNWNNKFHQTDSEECLCQRFNNLLELILQSLDCSETSSFDINMKGKDGYYTQNPEANPQPFVKKVSGDFNDADNGNEVYSSTRQNVGTVEYYGDFAVLTVKGSAYKSGFYGWRNGEFIDNSPSWESFSYCELYYKGDKWYHLDSEDCVDLISESLAPKLDAIDDPMIAETQYDKMYEEAFMEIFYEQITGQTLISIGDKLYQSKLISFETFDAFDNPTGDIHKYLELTEWEENKE